MVLVGSSPVYNTIIFYILIVSLLLIIKPGFMYCSNTKRFKSFGFGENKTLFCFPLICIACVIILYFLFLLIDIFNNYLDSNK